MHNLIKMKRILLKKYNLVILLIMLFYINTGCSSNSKTYVKVKINNKIYKFEIAANSQARKKGLMFRKTLDKNSGMLFIYPEKRWLSFYMKNTYIPLDIAFLDETYKILNIEQMKPLNESSVHSKGKAQYALEVNRGFFDRVGLKQGDKLELVSAIPFLVE